MVTRREGRREHGVHGRPAFDRKPCHRLCGRGVAGGRGQRPPPLATEGRSDHEVRGSRANPRFEHPPLRAEAATRRRLRRLRRPGPVRANQSFRQAPVETSCSGAREEAPPARAMALVLPAPIRESQRARESRLATSVIARTRPGNHPPRRTGQPAPVDRFQIWRAARRAGPPPRAQSTDGAGHSRCRETVDSSALQRRMRGHMELVMSAYGASGTDSWSLGRATTSAIWGEPQLA